MKSSLDILKELNVKRNENGVQPRRHNDFLFRIREYIKTRKEFENLKSDFYINSRGRKYPCFYLNEKQEEIMKISEGFNPRLKIKELGFEYILKNMFYETTFLREVIIGEYRVDFFSPSLNLIIEYNENHHKNKKNEDKKRIEYIKKYISYINYERLFFLEDECEPDIFIVEEGKEIEIIRNIIDTTRILSNNEKIFLENINSFRKMNKCSEINTLENIKDLFNIKQDIENFAKTLFLK